MPFYNRFDSTKVKLVSEMKKYDTPPVAGFGMVDAARLGATHGVGGSGHVAIRFECV